MARSDLQYRRYLTTPTTTSTRLGFVISIKRSSRSSRSRKSKLSLSLRAMAPALMSPSGVSSFSTGSPNPSVAAPKRVGTHNGSFHCDEALGCLMICLTNKFAGAKIVRTRDPQILDTLDVVLDVGGVYDPDCDRYDLHQIGFSDVFGHGINTKISSTGLVYKVGESKFQTSWYHIGHLCWSSFNRFKESHHSDELCYSCNDSGYCNFFSYA